MKRIKVLITSGGTIEHIDSVRVLTNISTGQLGCFIANEFLLNTDPNNFEVHHIYVKGSDKLNENLVDYYTYEVTDVNSVIRKMEELVPQMNIVIHSMAISDFGFKQTLEKLKSNSPEDFIESMRQRIYVQPKILSFIKEWNSNCFLVSFKFESNLDHAELIHIAKQSMIKNKSDIVVANDKKEMDDNKSHIAYILTADNEFKVTSKINIARKLFDIIDEKVG